MSRLSIFIEQRHKALVWLFFAVFLAVGTGIYKDYGISWDEPISRHGGGYAAMYAVHGDRALFSDNERYHGPAFEMFLVGVESILKLTDDPRATFLMRHLLTFLLFYAGVVFFYLLCRDHFRSWKAGLLGSLFLILSPRIFAHSFYNSKDIPFLALFIISIYTLIRYLDNRTLYRASVHALANAFLIDIRILGIIVPFFTVAFLAGDLLITRSEKKKGEKIIPGFLVYTFLLISFTILFWPVLWPDPVYHFIEAFRQMSAYPWRLTILYLGEYIKGTDLPWHYIPVWIAISTPLLYTFFFIAGSFVSIKELVMNPVRFYTTKRNDLIFLLWFFLPLGVVIASGSVVYDAWRHMFFIYPAFLILSLTGMLYLFALIEAKFQGASRGVMKSAFIGLVALSLIHTARIMVEYHPYQNVYFNRLAGRDMKEIKKNFELDYWGLSYRQALEYILKNDSDRVIRVYVANQPGRENARILPAADRRRLVYVDDPDEAEYFLSNYRWHKDEYSFGEEYYSISIDGAKIMTVLKLPGYRAKHPEKTDLKSP
ncbi:MAG: hypothetical protein GXP46_02265 [Deferribacteres bacterium]|nr:hypothetical protein [Deferribacteres bacterium]